MMCKMIDPNIIDYYIIDYTIQLEISLRQAPCVYWVAKGKSQLNIATKSMLATLEATEAIMINMTLAVTCNLPKHYLEYVCPLMSRIVSSNVLVLFC